MWDFIPDRHIRGNDLPWIESAALIPHTPIDITFATLFLFQIAILANLDEKMLLENCEYHERAGEDVHA